MVLKDLVKTIDTVYCRKSEQTEESAMKSLFEKMGGTYFKEVIIFCPTWPCLKPLLLVSGASGGGTTWKHSGGHSTMPYFSEASWMAIWLRLTPKHKLCFPSRLSNWQSKRVLQRNSKLKIRWNGSDWWTTLESERRILSIISWFTPDIKENSD